MQYIYKPSGVCSSQMTFEIEDDSIKKVSIEGGCDGNAKGIIKLIENENIDVIIQKLSGISCRRKPTSCPDQIAVALKLYKEKRNM